MRYNAKMRRMPCAAKERGGHVSRHSSVAPVPAVPIPSRPRRAQSAATRGTGSGVHSSAGNGLWGSKRQLSKRQHPMPSRTLISLGAVRTTPPPSPSPAPISLPALREDRRIRRRDRWGGCRRAASLPMAPNQSSSYLR